MAIYVHIFIGWSFLYLPSFAPGGLKYNVYLCLPLAAILVLPTFWMAADLARIYPDMTFSAALVKVYGRFLGRFFAVIYLVFIFMVSNMAFRESHLMVYNYFFKRTPFYLLPTLFIAGSLYLGLKGIGSIGRLASFMLIPPLFVIFLLELLGLVNVDPVNILPVFSGSPGQWWSSILDLTFPVLPGATLALYMAFIRNPKNVTKVGLSSMGIIFPVFFLAILGTVGAFGPTLVKSINWPVVEFFHIIDYPYLLLEQAGLFFLISWYASLFVALTQVFFIIGYNLNSIFPVVKYNWFVLFLNSFALAFVNLPINLLVLRNISMHSQKIVTIYLLAIIPFTWIIARLRSTDFQK